MVRAEFFTDADAYAAVIEPLVNRDPDGATMVASVLANHLARPFPGGPLLVAVLGGDQVQLAALRVPDFPLLFVVDPDIEDPATVFTILADAVLATGETIVGFSGRRVGARALAAAWTAGTGVAPEPRMWSLLYRLTGLVEPVGVPGAPRAAALQDAAELDVLARWFAEFRRETGVARTPSEPDPCGVLRHAARGEVFTLWTNDGQLVAVAGHSPVRRGRARIAPVYTPPGHRRRGFGSAATAAAVHSAWRAGAVEVTLFTDAEYPAANEVYRRLGFEVVGEFAEFDVPTS